MKGINSILFIIIAIVHNRTVNGCKENKIPTDWIDLDGKCLEAMRLQIQSEVDASYIYMAMGGHFSRDTVNRPGFAELFFKASRDEREHATKLTDYLSMRGKLTDDITHLLKTPNVKTHSWQDGVSALKDALELETIVTKQITDMVKICELEEQYHLVDYLTYEFLNEQLKGQRDLAGKLVTLKKLIDNHGYVGEFLFDIDLLDESKSSFFENSL